MFRKRNPQGSLFESSFLLPPEKQKRLDKTWAGQFRDKALPLIDEQAFADFYCRDNGRPNRAVQTIVGFLILKEMFDLTWDGALGALEYDLRWQVALGLTPEEAHFPQKTLHNFCVKLMRHERGAYLFQHVSDQIIEALGTRTVKQRLDSTHLRSNIENLTRLGLFCETIRLFLKQLGVEQEAAHQATPVSWRRRYLKEDGQSTAYEDGKREQVQRRLPVAARDLWRLIDRFRGEQEIAAWESYQLLVRLFDEQCEVLAAPAEMEPGAPDAADGAAPAVVRTPKQIKGGSLQSPHDADATYGHKGKGYEVQVAETFGNKTEAEPDKPELITHISVTPSAGSDADALGPVLADLKTRGHTPHQLNADTTYTSTQNVLDAQDQGVDLVGPVPGNHPLPSDDQVTLGDFEINVKDSTQTRCPVGRSPSEQVYDAATGKLKLIFAMQTCRDCPLRSKCPMRTDASRRRRVLQTDRKTALLEWRRRRQTSLEFRDDYAPRAGIEATHSELKRGHGLGHLRVRQGERVKLVVYLKGLACNVKRYVMYEARRVIANLGKVCAEILPNQPAAA